MQPVESVNAGVLRGVIVIDLMRREAVGYTGWPKKVSH